MVLNNRAANQDKKNQHSSIVLEDGARIGVIGGGPAGAFFSYFALILAKRTGIQIVVDIYERRDFATFGPTGCNMCAGVISESLIQALSVEGIELPSDIVQRGMNSFVLHTSSETVTMYAPFREMRIATVYRGGGPKGASQVHWKSFDDYLLQLANANGANIIRGKVTDITWNGDKPQVHVSEKQQVYDLIVGAVGVNSPSPGLFEKLGFGYQRPKARKTFNCELELGSDFVTKELGTSMHAFLLNIPKLEFAAIVPKWNYATMCLIGDDMDTAVLESFKQHRVVRNTVSNSDVNSVIACNCAPLASLGQAVQPYGDRVVLLGDCGMSRLNKDGIGSAYRTAKVAAVTALFTGVAADDFRSYFWPRCKSIHTDNQFGRILYFAIDLVKKSDLLTRGVMRMTKNEQLKPGKQRRMSMVLWNMFTGSAPYREIFISSLHPAFIVNFICSSLLGLVHKVEPAQNIKDIEETVMEKNVLGKVYNSGEIIVRQGDKENCMYVIQSGKAEVLRMTKDNEELRLATLSKGDIFGEMALFQEETRAATVRALGDVRVITVDKRIFLRRVHEDPSFAFTVLQKMSQRIRDLNDKMAGTKA